MAKKKKQTKKVKNNELEQMVKDGKNLQPKNINHEPNETIFKTLPSSTKDNTEQSIEDHLRTRVMELNQQLGQKQKELEQQKDIIEAMTFQTLLTKAYSEQLEQALNQINRTQQT